MVANHPFAQAEGADAALYDYIAQTILRGGTPYRDVIDVKGPGAPFLSALAMVGGRLIATPDILSVRVLHVIMVGAMSAVTYLVARAYLQNRTAAIIACLVPLVPSGLARLMLGGTQPKLLFGLLSLWLIARNRPFMSGVASMMSFLCLQPGLMFTGVSLLVVSRYFSHWRDGRVLKLFAGAACPWRLSWWSSLREARSAISGPGR